MERSKLVELAEYYISKGYKIIPVVFRGKKPKCKPGESWTDIVISTPSQIGDYFGEPSNIGIRLGGISNDLTDIDLDCPEAVAIAKNFDMFKKGAQFGRKGAGVNHYFFRCKGAKTEKFTDPITKKTILEIRSDGAQTVVPPSIHKDTGEEIEWYSKIEPREVEWHKLLCDTRRIAALSLLARHWEKGQRQDSAMALAGWFLRSGVSMDLAIKCLEAIVTTAEDEEADDRLKVIGYTFKRYENGDNFYGYKKCSELFGKNLMQKVSEWLDLESDEEAFDTLPLEDTGGKPSFCLSEKDLTAQREFCWNVIREQCTKNPKIFMKGGNLSRIKVEKDIAVMIEPLNEHSLVAELSELIYFYVYVKKEAKQVYPPPLLVKTMLIENNPPVPEITRISSIPVFDYNGQLLSSKGFHEVAELWLDRDFDTSDIPDSPSKEDVFKARDYLLTELFADFPFDDPCGKAYMFSAMLQNYVRAMISGPTPMYVVDAISREGTGKSLLSSVVAYVGTGKIPDPMASTSDEDEVRKRITTNLMAGIDVILVDNINKKWKSTAFATALTSTMWQDRVLGGNSSVRCKNECVWIGNGNGVEPSRELARRVVLTMLDAKTSMPWTRDANKFRHPELMSWVEDNIDSLVKACLTIIKGWVSGGCPKSSKTLGSYEQWAKIMGGILEYAEIPGFLENLDKVYENMDQYTMSWVEYLPIWRQYHGSDPVGVAELWKLADEHSMLLEVLGEGTERSQKTKLGSALRDLNGRYLGEWKVEEATKRGKGGTKQYILAGGEETHIFKESDPDPKQFFVEQEEKPVVVGTLKSESETDVFDEVLSGLDNFDVCLVSGSYSKTPSNSAS